MSKSRQHDSAVKIRSFGVTFEGWTAPLPQGIVSPAAGEWHQLIYATRGALTLRTEECAWVVPPHRGVWIPSGFKYQVDMTGIVALRILYLHARQRQLPRLSSCAVVNISPLLRELILRTVRLGALDSDVPEQKRLTGVILDELRILSAVPLQLPLPHDPRAARFASLVHQSSGISLSTANMLRQCGSSRRTMERLFRAETAMSLGQWLRRQKLLEALRRISSGETITAVAIDLGYNSPSAFIAMFRRELGETPRRYFETLEPA
ncbi:MAG TPA: helix-turn-helix transcriptional regulator [Bryobacteraceae bacterium]|nr:helix-turn-helix transcriptional regulator [Bryobacteraceae bacterium]